MADTQISNLTAESSLQASDDFPVQRVAGTDAKASTWALMGGLELDDTYSGSANHGSVSATVGKFYRCNLSGLTSGMTMTLPASAQVGERIGFYVSIKAPDNDQGSELGIKANGTDTLNGIQGATGDWSRLFIANECVIVRCIVADTIWIVEQDGRIPCIGRMSRSATGSENYTSATETKMVVDTKDIDSGGVVDLTNNEFVVRRAGTYMFSGQTGCAQATDGNYAYIAVGDGQATPAVYSRAYGSLTTVGKTSAVQRVSMPAFPHSVAAGDLGGTSGDFCLLYYQQSATANQYINSWFAVHEVL